ncbi:MAG: hypothetical protein II897_09440, partial [Clostridia bacterium]|nr:hypothetical protein [Clostridia bacterium]
MKQFKAKAALALLLSFTMILAVLPGNAMASDDGREESTIAVSNAPEASRGDYSITTLEAMTARAEALVNYQWTPSVDIDTWNENEYNGSTVFEQGSTVVGVPYTLFTSEVVSWSLCSLEQYINVASINYSATAYCNSMSATRTGPVYGSCCVDLVCEVFGGSFMSGSSPRYHNVTAIRNSSYATTLTGQKVAEIKAGDAVSDTTKSHIIWVGDITDTQITIYEQTPPVARKVVLDRSSHTDDNGFFIYSDKQYSVVTRSNGIIYPNSNSIISQSEIDSAASAYGISSSSEAYSALQRINTYYDQLSGNLSGTLIFFFEGVGNNSSSDSRMNAMCVVIKSGEIKYVNRNSTTIPDYPFDPSKNEGTDMPTIKSGVHSFTTVNHKGQYAALNITAAPVLRHSSQTNYYDGTSYGINIHRRSSDSIAPSGASWVNSAGCLLVGVTPNTSSSASEYARFIQAVGIVGQTGTAGSTYTSSVTGKVVVDRSFANQYLTNVGYSNGARIKLGADSISYPELVSDSKYSSFKGFKGYLCTSDHVVCYNRDLATSPGRIYTSDYCTINDVYTNGWCQVACPWND